MACNGWKIAYITVYWYYNIKQALTFFTFHQYFDIHGYRRIKIFLLESSKHFKKIKKTDLYLAFTQHHLSYY